MDRFVAMVWNDANQSRPRHVSAWSQSLHRLSPRWTVVLDTPGLRVFSLIQRGDAPIVTRWSDAEGVVIGPLFERGRERRGRVLRLDREEAGRAVRTGGASLIQDYWGNYVALWRDPNAERSYALRDPCGAVPCFMTSHNGVDLLFSHADDIAHLSGLRFTIDWTYLQAFFLFNYFITKYTGLKEVTELLGGERMEWTTQADKRLSFLWNGAEIAAKPNLQSFDDAKAELRETAEACFAAWGNEYRNVVALLSGGLDSSTLVNLLRRVSDARITALHYLGVGYEQYEAKLARLAAAHAAVELVELPLDPSASDVRPILKLPKLARPTMQMLAVQADVLVTGLGERVQADAFMAGDGGDSILLQRGVTKRWLADYLKLNGFYKEFLGVAYDAAMLQRNSIWSAVTDALNIVFLGRKWRPYEFLISQNPANCAATTVPNNYKFHPWIGCARLPHGKADHLLNVIGLYNYYTIRGHGLERDAILPFFSQPLAEFALRTPTYRFCRGGLDRSLQRQAFADILPDAVLRRTGKGAINSYLLHSMQQNLTFFRELILEGELLSQGWLDRTDVERMLTPNYVVHGGGAAFLYQLVVAEAWLRTWHDQGARRRVIV